MGFPPEMYQPLLKAISPQASAMRFFVVVFRMVKHLQGKPGHWGWSSNLHRGDAYNENITSTIRFLTIPSIGVPIPNRGILIVGCVNSYCWVDDRTLLQGSNGS